MRGFCPRYAQILLAIFFLVAPTPPAHADIDQHCLTQCIANGGGANACLPQCRYGAVTPDIAPPGSTTTPSAPKPSSPHDVFKPLIPSDNSVIVSHKAAPPPPDKDYTCMAQCLRGGGAIYQSCEQRCTKPVCAHGTILCGGGSTMSGTIR